MPSWRNLRVVSPFASVGKSAKQIEMCIAVMTSSTVLAKRSASKVRSSRRNFSRFSDARLQLELSRCMYSEHGLEAVIRPDSGAVCQSLIVSSYWMPGSAHSHAARRSEEHTSELQSRENLVCRLLLEKKKSL